MFDSDLTLSSCVGERSITDVAKTLSALPKLEYVDLGFDSLEGPLDSACGLARTRKLESLNLMNNALSGSIPTCFTQLPELVELHLDYNQLTGSLPAFDTANSPMVYFSAAYQVGDCLLTQQAYIICWCFKCILKHRDS